MSRTIDFSNPEGWDADDKAYLRERPETVPPEYRHLVIPAQPVAPLATAQDPRIMRLYDWVRMNAPDRAGEDPVTVVLDMLDASGMGASADDTADETDDYDQWTVKELADEAARRDPQVTIPDGANQKHKAPWITALRAWDAEHPS